MKGLYAIVDTKLLAARGTDPVVYAQLRRKTIDVAFPVSRERIRRAALGGVVRAFEGFKDVANNQIEQAAINLLLSAEIAEGRAHFAGFGGDFRKLVWTHILNRIERADGKDTVAGLDPRTVANQIELDVMATLTRSGGRPRGTHFRSLQALFRQKGYAGE